MSHLYSRFIDRPSSHRSGLTRVELLVFVALLLILAAILWAPVHEHYEQVEITRAVEGARTINTLLSQYATDNNGVYPVGAGTPAVGTSEGIALNLLQNNYAPDASAFAVGSTPKYSGKASDFSDITAANLSWDFTAGATATTGITSAVSDGLPVVFTTGETVDYAGARGHGLVLAPSGKGPFGREGIIAAYKGGSALFISSKPDAKQGSDAFIRSNFNDTGTYTQIRP